MTSLRCSSKLTESTIRGHIKDNEGSLKTVETTEASATNTQTILTARADTQMTLTARADIQITLTARDVPPKQPFKEGGDAVGGTSPTASESCVLGSSGLWPQLQIRARQMRIAGTNHSSAGWR